MSINNAHYVLKKEIRVAMHVQQEKGLLESIKEKDRRFQAYMENTREAIWRIDLQPPLPLNTPEKHMVDCIFHHTIITEANDAMAKMYGYTEGREIVGRPLSDFMSATDQENISAVHELVRKKFLVQDVIPHERKAVVQKRCLSILLGIEP